MLFTSLGIKWLEALPFGLLLSSIFISSRDRIRSLLVSKISIHLSKKKKKKILILLEEMAAVQPHSLVKKKEPLFKEDNSCDYMQL